MLQSAALAWSHLTSSVVFSEDRSSPRRASGVRLVVLLLLLCGPTLRFRYLSRGCHVTHIDVQCRGVKLYHAQHGGLS